MTRMERVTDSTTEDLVREGLFNAVSKTLRPAAMQRPYPGHFTVTAATADAALEAARILKARL